MIKTLLFIGSGSFIGGVARYLTSRAIQNSVISSFPWGTFVVNITGCFLIGLLYGISERTSNPGMEWRLFLTVGFCGGFTTFSTFSLENMALMKDGNFIVMAFYAAGSVFLGLLATYFGNMIIKLL